MTYTRAERNLLVTALNRLLLHARTDRPADIADGYDTDPDLIEALRDKIHGDDTGTELHAAHANVGPGFLALGNTAGQAETALYAALRRYSDDLYLDPAIISDAAVQAVHGPPGAVFRGGEPYPPLG